LIRCNGCRGRSRCRSSNRRWSRSRSRSGNLNDGGRGRRGDRFHDRLSHRFWRWSRSGYWLNRNRGTTTRTIADNDEHSANGNCLVFLNEDLLDNTGNRRRNLSVNLVC
jgi:hypothetical protein